MGTCRWLKREIRKAEDLAKKRGELIDDAERTLTEVITHVRVELSETWKLT